MKNPFSRKSPSKSLAAEVDWDEVKTVIKSVVESELNRQKSTNPDEFNIMTRMLSLYCDRGAIIDVLTDGEINYNVGAATHFIVSLRKDEEGYLGTFRDLYIAFLDKEKELALNTGFRLTQIGENVRNPNLRKMHYEELEYKKDELERILQDELTERFATKPGVERR